MCILSIEWIWVELYGKKGRKTHILGNTGTISVLFFCLGQYSYFSHNFLISYPN